MNDPEKDFPLPVRPSQSDLVTEVHYRFLRRHLDIFDFFFFVFEMSSATDQIRIKIANELEENIAGNEAPAMDQVRKYWSYLSETICVRMTDNFLCFLSESIQHCMLKNPNLLKSSEMVRIDDILKFSKKSDIIQFLIDKKINEISYGGVADIINFLESRTGIKLVELGNELDLLTLTVELRNTYTHNRGIVNHRFLRKVGQAITYLKAKNGDRVAADFDLLVMLSNNLFFIAQRLDRRISKKFRIRRKRYELY